MSEIDTIPHIFEDSYYQRLSTIEERHWWARGMRDVMAQLFKRRLTTGAPLRILDVGCGTGYLLHWLRRYAGDNAPVGVDIAPRALHFCRSRGVSKLARAHAGQLPFADQSFDLVICIDLIQHLEPSGAAAGAIEEIVRVLRRGGLLYLRTNSALGHRPLQGVDPNLYRRYTLDTVSAMLETAGLTVERATYINALPGLWAALREYMSVPKASAPIGPGLTIAPPSLSRSWIDTLLATELALEAWLIGSAGVDLGFGHSSAYLARR